MFETLSERLQSAVSKIKGYGVITEDNIGDMLREIRLALLEADVNYTIVKEFIDNVKEKALGEEVRKSIKPGELFVKIVKDELVELLGSNASGLVMEKFNVVLMSGLQGSGKTTTVGKLGNLVRKKYNRKPMFVACDVYRPAAIDQLKQLGKELNIFVYEEGQGNPVDIAVNGINYAKENGYDYVLVDTAGRLHVDQDLMNEIKNIEESIKPNETLLVIDSMMGQDAINVINGFNDTLSLTGCILTKMDGDTKGGVALSVKHLTNVPIKLIGDSEKLDGLSEFYPDRMANRILGNGDLLSIIEKTENLIDEDVAIKQAEKLKKGKYDLEDFLENMKMIKKIDSFDGILKMIPGAKKMGLNDVNIDPKDFKRVEAIVLSMTPYERKHPEVIKASRKERIAKGCGRSVTEVNKLLTQFEQMQKMVKQMSNGKFKMPF